MIQVVSQDPIVSSPPIATGFDSSNFTIETHDSLERLYTLENEWRALFRESGTTFPFASFDWITTWWKHFPENRRGVKDNLFVHTLRNKDGKLLGIAPLMLTERPAFGPLRTRYVQFIGPDSFLTELAGPLALPEYEDAIHVKLLEHLENVAQAWDWLRWGGIRPGSNAERFLSCEPGTQWADNMANFVLPLAGSWDKFRSGLPRNVKESLRKCYNSLKRDNLKHELYVARRPEEMPDILEHFFRLHAARSLLADTVPHKNFFRFKKTRVFLVDLCQTLARRDEVRIFALKVNNQPVAIRVGFVVNDALYFYYSGYDPAYRQYSVMTTTVTEALRYATENGFKQVNLSMGRDVSKTRWRPTEYFYREALRVSPAPWARFSRRTYLTLRRAVENSGMQGLASRFLLRRFE